MVFLFELSNTTPHIFSLLFDQQYSCALQLGESITVTFCDSRNPLRMEGNLNSYIVTLNPTELGHQWQKKTPMIK